MKEENVYLKHYSILSDIFYFVKYFKKYESAVLICCMIEIILSAVLPLVGIYLPKITLDLVTNQVDIGYAIIVLGLFTFLMMGVYGINTAVGSGKYYLYNAQRTNIIGLLFLKSLRIKYADTESGEIKKAYWKAVETATNGDWSASSRIISGSITMMKSVLCFLLYSTVLSFLSIWMVAVLIGLSLLSYLISLNRIKFTESLREEEAEVTKKYYCVKNSMGNVEAAKDIRIFGMNHWLTKLRDISLGELRELNKKRTRKAEQCEKLNFALSMLRDFMAYGFLLYQVTNQGLSVSEFVLYFGAITGFSGFVGDIMNGIAELREAANSTDYYRAYMELPEEDRNNGKRHIIELEFPVKIEFRNVCFAYKEYMEEDEKDNNQKEGTVKGEEKELTGERNANIFRNFNLTINSGEKIALVGVNGAGKTTFVKLLTGMLEPDSGQILINGIDTREFPKEEFYKLFSVVFQEQFIPPFTIAENIALNRRDEVDEAHAWQAVEKAGLKQVFEEKNVTLDSWMTRKLIESGIDFSGGQRQRFLLARALYKDAPILILDEPTAALDPIAESEIYESYHKYSSQKTSVFISHRLASTRFSDRIIMIENGEILEMGTHKELMEKNGAYARMYEVQSNYYK